MVFGMPIANMAYAYARLACPPDMLPERLREPARRVTSAMVEYPEMIGGTLDFGSNLMKNSKGAVFAKGGAEGLFCVGVPKRGIGIAVKSKTEDPEGCRLQLWRLCAYWMWFPPKRRSLSRRHLLWRLSAIAGKTWLGDLSML